MSITNFRKYVNHYVPIVIGVTTTLFGIFSTVFQDIFSDRIVFGVLIALVGFILVIFTQERIFEKSEHSDIHDELVNFKPAISLLTESIDCGVERIFPKRKGNEEIENNIKEHLKRPDNNFVAIAAIALPKFFHSNQIGYQSEIKELLERNVHVRILLLDPRGKTVLERAERERLNPVADIERSLKELQSFIDQNKNIEVRLYDFPPIMFLFVDNFSAFIEPYHFGRVYNFGCKNEKNAQKGCIGGLVPVIKVKNLHRGDKAYSIYLDHFDYIWQKKSIPLYSGVIIQNFDISKKSVVLYNTHSFTDIELDDWSIEGSFEETKIDCDIQNTEDWFCLHKFRNGSTIKRGEEFDLNITDINEINQIQWSSIKSFRLKNKIRVVSYFGGQGFCFNEPLQQIQR